MYDIILNAQSKFWVEGLSQPCVMTATGKLSGEIVILIKDSLFLKSMHHTPKNITYAERCGSYTETINFNLQATIANIPRWHQW